MQEPAEDRPHLRGHIITDKAVLKYLQDMIDYCRRYHHREMTWYYEAGWQFASSKIYLRRRHAKKISPANFL